MCAENGFSHLFVARENAQEAALVANVRVHAISSLIELVELFVSETEIPRVKPIKIGHSVASSLGYDMKHIKGQEFAKRALTIAASGGHNVLMVGPPGSGKTMLARRLPTILPPLTDEEHLEVVAIHSIGGTLPAGAIPPRVPPFRAPGRCRDQTPRPSG